jgi:hypothetical protein
MADNAFLTWLETPEPWAPERELIAAVDLPLNLDQNRRNAFHAELTRCRARAPLARCPGPTADAYRAGRMREVQAIPGCASAGAL